MTRNELAAWLQVALGLAGLFVAVNQGGAALDAIGSIAGGNASLPPEFAGSQGIVRVFLFLLVLVICGALSMVGLAILMSSLFRHIGAQHPHHVAFAFVVGLLLIVTAMTSGIFGNLIWIWAGGSAVLSLVSAGVAGVSKDSDEFWATVAIGGFFMVILCGIATAIVALPPQQQTPTPVSEAAEK